MNYLENIYILFSGKVISFHSCSPLPGFYITTSLYFIYSVLDKMIYQYLVIIM